MLAGALYLERRGGGGPLAPWTRWVHSPQKGRRAKGKVPVNRDVPTSWMSSSANVTHTCFRGRAKGKRTPNWRKCGGRLRRAPFLGQVSFWRPPLRENKYLWHDAAVGVAAPPPGPNIALVVVSTALPAAERETCLPVGPSGLLPEALLSPSLRGPRNFRPSCCRPRAGGRSTSQPHGVPFLGAWL